MLPARTPSDKLYRKYGKAFCFSRCRASTHLQQKDHRKLGKELKLFALLDEGPGFPFFLPKGMTLKNTLLEYWREIHKELRAHQMRACTEVCKIALFIEGNNRIFRQILNQFHLIRLLKPLHVFDCLCEHLYPDVKLAIGPAIADGFYYDFDREKAFTQEELEALEEEMKKIVLKCADADFRIRIYNITQVLYFAVHNTSAGVSCKSFADCLCDTSILK